MAIIEGYLPEPKLGDKEKKEYDNNKLGSISLEEQKADIMASLYSSNNETTEKIDKEKNQKIDENPNSPLINGLESQGLLTKEEAILIKEALIENGNIDNIIYNIEGLSGEKKDQIVQSISYLESDEGKTKCIEKFNRDFSSEIDELKKVDDFSNDGEKKLTLNQSNLLDNLGSNYYSLGNPKGGKETDKEALNKAFKITLNIIIQKGGKIFKRPNDFDKMKGIINNNSLSFKERFDELSKVDNLVINTTSIGIGKQNKDFGKMKKGIEKKEISLAEKFNNLKIEYKLAKSNNDLEGLKNIEIELVKLEIDTTKPGDVIIGGEIDVLVDDINDLILEQN